jgi:hypothetical protein
MRQQVEATDGRHDAWFAMPRRVWSVMTNLVSALTTLVLAIA